MNRSIAAVAGLWLALSAGIALAQLVPGQGPLVPGSCALFSGLIPGCGPLVPSGSGGGGPPPACSNSLDFTQSCNSQYMPALL